jgi:DNA-binding transcriptional regulator PaaX
MNKKTVTSADAFMGKYGLSAREAVCTPMILIDGAFKGSGLPYPTMRHIKDLAEFARIAPNAVRTSLSRLHKDGRIAILRDKAGSTRYRMTEASMDMGTAALDRMNQEPGYLLAIFSFTRDDAAERSFVRETLKYYGFKKLAQNTYINAPIATESLRAAMREAKLEKNLYLFRCADVEDADLTGKILSLFGIEERGEFLNEFYRDLRGFLDTTRLDDGEIIHRLCYAGPVQWKVCFMDEPPFPLEHLPKDYPLARIISFYDHFIEKYRPLFRKYYLGLE